MTINDIKAALAARAASANVKPARPVIEPPAHPEAPSAAVTTEQQPLLTDQEQPKPKTRTTRKSAPKKPAAAQTPATVSEEPPAAPMPEPPVPSETQQKPKATQKRSTTRKTTSKKSESTATPITTEPIEAIIAHYLKPGIDYNTIPGCGRKPALMKAGAEHLAAIFGFRSTSEVVHRIEALKEGFILYEIATTIYDTNGRIVAVGLGSCNTRERRYQRDFAGSLNTTMKMAKKRSYVDAILTACHASGTFTQDIDEIGRDLHEVPAGAQAQEA